MADGREIEVLGLQQLLGALDALPERLERNVLNQATKRGMEEIARPLGARLVGITRTGRLARSVRLRNKRIGGLPAAVLSIGNKQAWYARLVLEKGARAHVIRPRKRGGALFFGGRAHRMVRHPGFAARLIVKPVFESGVGGAIGAFTRYVRERIGREWNALARKGLLG